MKVLIIDPESGNRKKLNGILNATGTTLQIAGTTTNIADTTDWLSQNPAPDMILVNREMASERLFASVGKKYKTIITFSSENGDCSFEAFRYNNSSHLFPNYPDIKMHNLPDPSKYNQAVPRANKTAIPMVPEIKSFKERFLVKQGQKFTSIHIDLIAYFLSEDRFIFFRTFDNQKFLTEFRIENLESMLSPMRFFRVNRSYLVSINAVQHIQQHFGNRLKLFLEPQLEKEVIVSRERVADFKTWLGG